VRTWLVVVDPQQVTGRSGYVPAATMRVVEAKTEDDARALGGWP